MVRNRFSTVSAWGIGGILPIHCPNVALDERLESLSLLLAPAHHVRVDPQRERRVGVPELLHHVRRVLADRHQDRGERMPEVVRGDPKRQGL